MTRTTLLLALVAIALPALAAPAPPSQADARALAMAWAETTNAHDAAAHIALYADGALFAFPDGMTLRMTDRAEHARGTQAWYDSVPGWQISVEVQHVRLGADHAVVFLTGTASSAQGTMPLHVALVMETDAEGTLRIAAEHAMSPSPRG